jgi:hypothetical protein
VCCTAALASSLTGFAIEAGDVHAAVTTVGSPLASPATLNTTDNLAYKGTDTAVPPSPEAPNGVIHTAHFGADTVLWNTAANAVVPADGQAVKVRLEGCALPAPGGPAPLTQIHFQTLAPQSGGRVRVELSSQPFDVPVCGVGGADGSTISIYEPTNLCVRSGDYVGFNDEGGFVERYYRAGVPYEVLGSASGAGVDSFIRGNGTGNGSLLSPLDTTAMDGFASTGGAELMMQVLLGTGPDARYVCAGGSKDAAPTLSPLSVHQQTDGINSKRIVSVAIFCRPASGCPGMATLTFGSGGHGARRSRVSVAGRAGFNLPGGRTSHLPIRVSQALLALIRANHGATATLTAAGLGATVTQTISVKIF